MSMFRRAIATACAALVFALGVFAACPSLHAQLHHDADLTVGDGCAVVLFSNGVSAPLAMMALTPPAADWHEDYAPVANKIFPGSPRYLLRPERGPPGA